MHTIRKQILAYRSMCDKVDDGDELTRVGINERLDPGISRIVLDLNDVGENSRAIGLRKVLQ